MAHPRVHAEDDPVLVRLREVCLALPEAVEKVSHGRSTFAAGPTGKLFAVYGGGVKVRPGEHEPHDRAVLVKVDPGELPALDDDPRFFVPAYYGPAGWRGADLPPGDVEVGEPGGGADRGRVGWDEVAELVDASFRLVATRRLVAALDAGSGAGG